MGRVRPFVESDIPQVADLHRRVFRTGDQPSVELQQAYERYFRQIFLNSSWGHEDLPSLVCEESDGAIVGFLGIMPRRMSFRGRLIRAAISSQFIVEPGRRATLAAVQLAKTYLSGPQDLSIADEASPTARRLFEQGGGVTAGLYSLYWGLLLQPCRFFLDRLAKHRLLGPAAVAAAPVCRLVDSLAARIPGSPLHRAAPQASEDELDAQTLLGCVSEFSRDRSVRPEYDESFLNWLLVTLARKTEYGTFRKAVIRDAAGAPLGWYLYYVNRGGVGEVLQLGARRQAVKEVLNHLIYHAQRQGVAALSGRLEPKFMQELSENGCFFHHRGMWFLAHARHPELLEPIHSGDAFISRLEGEWCLRFK